MAEPRPKPATNHLRYSLMPKLHAVVDAKSPGEIRIAIVGLTWVTNTELAERQRVRAEVCRQMTADTSGLGAGSAVTT